MLSKTLKVMAIVILFPLFATCGVMTLGIGAGVTGGIAEGWEEAKVEAEADERG